MSEWMEDDHAQLADSPRRSAAVISANNLEHPINELPLRPPVCLEGSRPAGEAIRAMRSQRIGSVLVTRNGRLAGIFTERDVLIKVALGECDADRTPLFDVMSPDPETLPPEAPMAFALKSMTLGGYRHVPLTDDGGRPVGVVSVRDIVLYMVDRFPDQVLAKPPEPGGDIARSREGA